MIAVAAYLLILGTALLWYLISPASLFSAGPWVLAIAVIATGLGIILWRILRWAVAGR